MQALKIQGGRRLQGQFDTPGAKNSVLPILAASVLNTGRHRTVVRGVPALRDVHNMLAILEQLGCRTDMDGRNCLLMSEKAESFEVPRDLMHEMRSSIILLGALLTRHGQAVVYHPGGCSIGARPINIHLQGLRQMGAQISEEEDCIHASAARLKGADILLDFPSVGATENLMMAATLAKGSTIIRNAAREPEIVDLQNFLNRMGARVRGAGTNMIRIEGVESLDGTDYEIIPDRIVAGTMLVAAAITNGEILVTNIIPEHLSAVLAVLKKTGIEIIEGDTQVWLRGRPKKPVKLVTSPYPGFPTDLQPPMMALLTQAKGTSVIQETIFDSRLKHIYELNKMKARIEDKSGESNMQAAEIQGLCPLKGALVQAPDLRAGAALVLAGLAAEGETVVQGLEHIERGYESLDSDLVALGASIRRVELTSGLLQRAG